jgi:hypothetical protein
LRGPAANKPLHAGAKPLLIRCAFNVWRTSMMDVVMMAIGFLFFALSIAYVYACDRL